MQARQEELRKEEKRKAEAAARASDASKQRRKAAREAYSQSRSQETIKSAGRRGKLAAAQWKAAYRKAKVAKALSESVSPGHVDDFGYSSGAASQFSATDASYTPGPHSVTPYSPGTYSGASGSRGFDGSGGSDVGGLGYSSTASEGVAPSSAGTTPSPRLGAVSDGTTPLARAGAQAGTATLLEGSPAIDSGTRTLVSAVEQQQREVEILMHLLRTVGTSTAGAQPPRDRSGSRDGGDGSGASGGVLSDVTSDLIKHLESAIQRSLETHEALKSKAGGMSVDELRLKALRDMIEMRAEATSTTAEDLSHNVLQRLMHRGAQPVFSPMAVVVPPQARSGEPGVTPVLHSAAQRQGAGLTPTASGSPVHGLYWSPRGGEDDRDDILEAPMPLDPKQRAELAAIKRERLGPYTSQMVLETLGEPSESQLQAMREDAEQLGEVQQRRATIRYERMRGRERVWEDVSELPRVIRSLALQFISWPWFDRFILLTILANCVFLAIDTPDLGPEHPTRQMIENADLVFTTIFIIEFFLKVLAIGFVHHESSYLQDPWNVLDFVIVISSVVALTGSSANVSGLRTFRVIRPLRTISTMKGLKILVTTFVRSIPMLMSTLIVLLFYFLVFGIVGMQLWAGRFSWRCFDITTGHLVETEEIYLCGGARVCAAGQFCGEWNDNPHGVVSFDNLFWAFSTIFQCATLEGWTEVQRMAEDVSSPVANVYFVILIFMGAFIAINLTLAVILTNFRESAILAQEAVKERMAAAQALETEREAVMRRMRQRRKSLARHKERLLLRTRKLAKDSGGSVQDLGALQETAVDVDASVPDIDRLDSVRVAHTKQLAQIAKRTASVRRSSLGSRSPSGAATTHFSFDDGSEDSKEEPKQRRSAGVRAKLTLTGKTIFVDDSEPEPTKWHEKPVLWILHVVKVIQDETALSGPRWVQRWEARYSSRRPPGSGRCLLAQQLCWKIARSGRRFTAHVRDAGLRLVENKYFSWVILVAIFLNSVTLALEHYGMDTGLKKFLDTSNVVFTIIFAAEMVLKLLSLGLPAYVGDPFNVFDGLIVIVSVVELFMDSESGLSVFRMMRIFRVVKLIRYFESMQMIVRVVTESLASFSWIAMLLALFTFIFAILGMQLFGTAYHDMPEGSIPRNNFATLHWSVITVFQVLAGENWNGIMYETVGVTSPLSVLFFISWLVIGQFALLNLLIAVLLDNFTRQSDDEEKAAAMEEINRRNAEKRKLTRKKLKAQLSRADIRATMDDVRVLQQLDSEIKAVGPLAAPLEHDGSDDDDDLPPHRPGWRGKFLFCVDPRGSASQFCRRLTSATRPLYQFEFRYRPVKIYFDGIIVFFILFSSVALAVEPPPNPNEAASATSVVLEVLFTTVFFLEMSIKVCARGLVLHEGSYLRDGYNVIDFVVVLASLLNPILSLAGVRVGFLRIVRGLRPLRLISRSHGMRTVVRALGSSVMGIINVIVLLLMVWLMFSILGVQLFAGKMHDCTDPSFPADTPKDGIIEIDENGIEHVIIPPCKGIFMAEDGSLQPRLWEPAEFNYDNVVNGLLSIVVMSSGEGWPAQMFRAADTTDVDRSPLRDASPMNAYFFVCFLAIGYFFAMNLFIGVVFRNFVSMKEKSAGFGFLTDEQREWVQVQRTLASVRPDREMTPPTTKWRRRIYDVVTHDAFDNLILLIIVLNVVGMAATWKDQPQEFTEVMSVVNWVFTAIFLVEAVLKIAAVGWGTYIADAWNRFDFTVVVSSVIDVAVIALIEWFEIGGELSTSRVIVRVFRILRVLRIIRLAKKVPGFRRIVFALRTSAPALANIGSLLGLVVFIYAVLGIFVFGNVKHGTYVNQYANFASFGRAMLTLLRCATGEEWQSIMKEVQNPEVGGTELAPLYFLSFISIAQFVMLNLFVMILLDDFDKTEKPTETVTTLREEDLLSFKREWAKRDPKGTGFIAVSDLEGLVRSLPPPLGVKPGTTNAEYLVHLQTTAIHTAFGRVEFRAVLLGLHRAGHARYLPRELISTMNGNVAHLNAQNERKLKISGAAKELQDRIEQSQQSGKPVHSLTSMLKPTTLARMHAILAIEKLFRDWLARSRKRIAQRKALEMLAESGIELPGKPVPVGSAVEAASDSEQSASPRSGHVSVPVGPAGGAGERDSDEVKGDSLTENLTRVAAAAARRPGAPPWARRAALEAEAARSQTSASTSVTTTVTAPAAERRASILSQRSLPVADETSERSSERASSRQRSGSDDDGASDGHLSRGTTPRAASKSHDESAAPSRQLKERRPEAVQDSGNHHRTPRRATPDRRGSSHSSASRSRRRRRRERRSRRRSRVRDSPDNETGSFSTYFSSDDSSEPRPRDVAGEGSARHGRPPPSPRGSFDAISVRVAGGDADAGTGTDSPRGVSPGGGHEPDVLARVMQRKKRNTRGARSSAATLRVLAAERAQPPWSSLRVRERPQEANGGARSAADDHGVPPPPPPPPRVGRRPTVRAVATAATVNRLLVSLREVPRLSPAGSPSVPSTPDRPGSLDARFYEEEDFKPDGNR